MSKDKGVDMKIRKKDAIDLSLATSVTIDQLRELMKKDKDAFGPIFQELLERDYKRRKAQREAVARFRKRRKDVRK